ncbi:hypothetical protein C5167_003790 [Papaver somniferum]|uniref:Phospholipid-transporting ATPase n=1 Tax=Papaver somniferum TaxID=3469 RepID=A0A4Y7L0U8_PAPSO|nr:hypothetical protein C5167_003790 [Papaver somniferum]
MPKGDQPLLVSSLSHSSSVLSPLPLSSSCSCLCPNSSYSPADSGEARRRSFDSKEHQVVSTQDTDCHAEPFHHSDSIGRVKRFHTADPHFFQELLLECPTQKGRQLVSWGAMELQGNSKPSEISMTSLVQEKLEKSQRVRHKSMQFEDNLSQEDSRVIYVNDPRKTNDKYEFTGNEIRTSKYTVITFLPKNLFIQFHRVAYLYFLAIAALNQLPPLAVFGRTVSLFPLLFVLCVTAIKDGYEDWRRHRSDRNENNRESLVMQLGKFRLKKWKKIRAGEVVKILANETIPCDMVLLGTSDASGIAYIQTMNLDGESNLKTRYARQETVSMAFDGGSIGGTITCEHPNRNIYEFTANMKFDGHKFPLSQSNIILRGCQLKNTEWVIGVVVYAGQETKAMLNSAASPSKRSRLESHMNRETLWLSVFLFSMCVVVAVGMGLWLRANNHQLDTLPYYRRRYITTGKMNGALYNFISIPMEILFSFLSSVIVFQIMIPISLYITMELVRLGQSYFMIEDKRMYCSNSQSRFQCRSLNINEDLGQIRYIFSDKTGTLTENKMEFRRASLYGKNYGSSLHDTDHSVQESSIEACNTVIPMVNRPSSVETFTESHEDVGAIVYQGESPDEQALVSAASAYGYTLTERTSGHIVVDVNGEKLRLDVLGLHEFDSVRKRMSVVIRFPNNAVKVLVKGADSSMLNILGEENNTDNRKDLLSRDIKHATQNHLTEYSREGLRTLVLASRDLTDEELEEWQCCYEEASTSNLLADAKVKYGVKSSMCSMSKHLRQKKIVENNYLEIPVETRISNAGQWNVETVPDMTNTALIIDGNSLVYILEKDLESELFDLATSCKVVLCCRVAPLQKAGIVDLIKSRTDDMTLAIGDGANDVSMIQMADVGVGLCGQEGRQAVMASDFAMGQFRFLKRLLLVHGHWNYQRVGYLVLYNFYRNAVFVLMLFWYILYTGYSTTSAITDWSSMLYSIIYTSVPTIVVGILDKDLSHKTLLEYPKLYGSGHRHESYNMPLFWLTMIDTLWQSLVLFYVPVFIFQGSTIDIWSMGSLWTIAVVVLVNIHLAMDIQRWLLLTHLATWGSIVTTYACMVVLDSIPIFPNYGTIYHLATSATYWITILLIIVLALLPRFLFKVLRQRVWPSDIQIAREAEILRKRRHILQSKPDQSSS